MIQVWVIIIISTLLVSAVSFSGALFLSLNKRLLQKIVFVLVSFAVGALLGNVFFILVPESFHEIRNGQTIGLFVLSGLLMMFIIEKFIQWNHNHDHQIKSISALGPVSLVTDALHNFTDGILIAASWTISPEVGIATTIAVLLHEIPQEISDFGILIHAGYSRRKALLYNFIAACTAIFGALLTIVAGKYLSGISIYILPIAAGGFIYLAGSDLIPELQREKSKRKSLLQFLAIVAGLGLMFYINSNSEHSHVILEDCSIEDQHHAH